LLATPEDMLDVRRNVIDSFLQACFWLHLTCADVVPCVTRTLGCVEHEHEQMDGDGLHCLVWADQAEAYLNEDAPELPTVDAISDRAGPLLAMPENMLDASSNGPCYIVTRTL
jgi:hypothetical protein